jgi:hypothetical protein
MIQVSSNLSVIESTFTSTTGKSDKKLVKLKYLLQSQILF